MNQDITNSPGGTTPVDRYLPYAREEYPQNKGQSMFGLPSIRAIIWRQRYILIGITILALAAGVVATMLMSPQYQATATVRVQPNSGQLVQGQDVVDPFISANEVSSYLETLSAVVQSRQMALRVVDDLDLTRNAEFWGEGFSATPPAGVNEASWRESQRQAAADRVRGGLSVNIPLGTRIMELGYVSNDRQMAALLANSYAENFLEQDLARTAEANAYALEYLRDQIDEVRQNLQMSEMEVIDYARSNRIIGQPATAASAVEGGSETGTASTLGAQSLSNVNQLYTEARARRIAAEARWRVISDVPAAMIPEVRDNPNIQTMRSQLAGLSSELADLQQRYRDDYPPVREKQAEVRDLEQRITTASNEIKNGLRSDYQIALRQEEGLAGELARVSGVTLDEQDRRVQYNLIDRDVEAQREQLATLLRRFNEVSSAANVRTSDLSLLDLARVPGAPSSPNLMSNLLIALILGLGLAGGIAILREAFDDRIHSSEDLESMLGVNALGQTFRVPEGSVTEDLANPFSALSEAYSSIRATLDYGLGNQASQVIQVTSGEAGEGKTTTSIALAMKYALAGKKVLLVDFDLRRPAITSRLEGERQTIGLVDVLYSRAALRSALMPPRIENLDVLPVAELPSNPVEILSSGLVSEFVTRARESYEVILLDSSPVIGIADAPLLSRFADATVLVVEANRSHNGQLRRSMRRLRDMNANIVGAVLTKFRPLEAGEAYGSQYKYYTYTKD